MHKLRNPEEGIIRIVTGKASLELRPNGNILVNNKLVENDKQVVEGIRKLIQEHFGKVKDDSGN